MSLLDKDSFCESANKDPEFLIAARFWNTSLKIEMEDDAFILDIKDGKISAINSAPAPDDAWDIKISGPADDWRNILEPIPRPFYQDIFAATVYHGLSYDGDLESMFAYYPALRRMVEIMRECAAAETGGGK